MYMKRALLSFAILALSAFAVASESTALAEVQYELSQAPSDLVVQSAHVNSFELTTAHSETLLQFENREVSKQERSIEPAFVLTTLDSEALNMVNEVGWRRSYNL